MRHIVYDGMAEAYDRRFDDGIIIHLKRGVVTAVSEDIWKILRETRKKNRINEVIGIDELSKRGLK